MDRRPAVRWQPSPVHGRGRPVRRGSVHRVACGRQLRGCRWSGHHPRGCGCHRGNRQRHHLGADNLVAGNRIKILTLTGGAGLTAGNTYYIVQPTSTTVFKLSSTLNGAAIDITSDSLRHHGSVVNDVLNAVIFGPEAYAFGDWGSIQTYFTQPGGTTDPLHQLTQVGWKGMFGAVIMGEGTNATGVTAARYRRIEHTSQL
jgi:hypothetical protein